MEIQHTNFGPISIIRCGYHNEKYDYNAHMHQFCEIIWVLDGEIEITTDGRQELAKAGDIIVITPFQVHSFFTPSKCKIWICVFSNNFIDTIPLEELCCVRDKAVFTPSKFLSEYIEGYDFPDRCFNFYKNRSANAFHTLRSIFYLIFAEYFNSSELSDRNMRINTLSKILIYISEHFREDITQLTVGKALGYSPRYISNCFDAIPNMNFRKMLNSLRIEYSKNLLISSDLNIIEIALESGFSGERSFHRSFLDIVGMTPGEYRKSRQR